MCVVCAGCAGLWGRQVLAGNTDDLTMVVSTKGQCGSPSPCGGRALWSFMQQLFGFGCCSIFSSCSSSTLYLLLLSRIHQQLLHALVYCCSCEAWRVCLQAHRLTGSEGLGWVGWGAF